MYFPGSWRDGGGFRGMGFLQKYYTSRYRPPKACSAGMVDCSERKEKVHFIGCLKCERFQVWNANDGDFKRCYHEFRDLSSRGFYDGTWDNHPENFDPESFERIQEQKRRNEEINREMELERAELEKKAELAKERSPYDYYGYEYYESDEDDDSEEDGPYDYDEVGW